MNSEKEISMNQEWELQKLRESHGYLCRARDRRSSHEWNAARSDRQARLFNR